MYQGFYNLASGMLTQSRNLNVISNNMVNLQTPGYKSDTMTSTTFGDEMLYRTERRNKEDPEALATVSKIKSADRTYVDYTQGDFEITDGLFDFALGGQGFFSIQTPQGERYTRNGAFSVDAQGFLTLEGLGQVLSADNQPIRIRDENFSVDGTGHITSVLPWEELTPEEQAAAVQAGAAAGEPLGVDYGTLKVVDFADYDGLHKEDNGLYSANQAQTPVETPSVQWKTLERSNVDMVEEMTAMMSSQRALQSAAQALKMYDQVMGKAVAEVGRI